MGRSKYIEIVVAEKIYGLGTCGREGGLCSERPLREGLL